MRIQTKRIMTRFIGDGKLPNKFYVSVHEDYLFLEKEKDYEYWTWLSDAIDFKPKGGVVAVFDNYPEAINYAVNMASFNVDYQANTITIEDRITGELYNDTLYFNPQKATIHRDDHADTSFTAKHDPQFRLTQEVKQ